jgi:MYXO-CTERM domain-containing protein
LDAAADAGAKSGKGGGCSMAGADATSGAVLGLSLLALVLAGRRRRRGGA